MVNTIIANKSNKIFGFYGKGNEKFLNRKVKEDLNIEYIFYSDYSNKTKVEAILEEIGLNADYELNIQGDNNELGLRFILHLRYQRTGMTQRELANLMVKDLAFLEQLLVENGEDQKYATEIYLRVAYDVPYIPRHDKVTSSKLKQLGFTENEYEGSTYERYDVNFNYIIRFEQDENKILMNFYSGNINKIGVVNSFYTLMLRLGSYYKYFVEDKEA